MKTKIYLVLLSGVMAIGAAPAQTNETATIDSELGKRIRLIAKSCDMVVSAAQNRYERAIEVAQKRRDLRVENAKGTAIKNLHAIAKEARNEGKTAETLLAYQEIHRLDPDNTEAIRELEAAGMLEEGSLKKALAGKSGDDDEPAEPGTIVKKVKVYAANDWQAYMDVSKGDVIEFSADGKWSPKAGVSLDADGDPYRGLYYLQAKLGPDSRPFKVGMSHKMTSKIDGRVYLGMRDDWNHHDNSGYLVVSIAITKAGEARE